MAPAGTAPTEPPPQFPPVAPGPRFPAVPLPPSPPYSPPAPSPDREVRTRGAVESILASIRRYLIVLALNFFTTLIFAGVAFSVGSPAGFGVSAYVSCGANPSDLPVAAAAQSGLMGWTYIADFFGLVALVVTLLAWLKWREGVRVLEQSSIEGGRDHVLAVVGARRYFSYTVWIWVGFIILSIAVVLLGVGVITATFVSGLQTNSTFQCTSELVGAVNAELRTLVTVLGIGSAVYSILLYWCATRSLSMSIGSISGPSTRRQLKEASWLILAGAGLTFGAIGLGYAVAFSLFSVASVTLLLVGFWRLDHAYTGWLSPRPPLGPPSSFGIERS